MVFVVGSGDHAAAGSDSTVDGSVSGSDVIQDSSELGKASDTLTPGIRADAGDHEAGLGGTSATGGLGKGGNAEPGAGSVTGLHEGDSSGAGSHGISGNTELEGSGVAGSHGLGENGFKNSDGGEVHRESTGLGSVIGTGTPEIVIHGEIDAKSVTESHEVYVSGSDLTGGAGIHTVSGNTEHGDSGVADSHELGGSGITNAGTEGHRVSGSRGHESSTETGVQIFDTNTGCSSDRTVGNVGERGDDERKGSGSENENGAHRLGDSDTDKSEGLAVNVSGHKYIITGTDGFVLGGAQGGSGDGPEEFQTKDAGVLDGSAHGSGTVDSVAKETDTFSGSSSEVNSGTSSDSGVDSVNSSDSGSHVGSGSQPDSGPSFSLSDIYSGSEVKGGKKLPVGVKG